MTYTFHSDLRPIIMTHLEKNINGIEERITTSRRQRDALFNLICEAGERQIDGSVEIPKDMSRRLNARYVRISAEIAYAEGRTEDVVYLEKMGKGLRERMG